jgi:hypothetical protein
VLVLAVASASALEPVLAALVLVAQALVRAQRLALVAALQPLALDRVRVSLQEA